MAVIRFGIIGAGNVGVGTARGDSFIRLLTQFEETGVTAIYDVSAFPSAATGIISSPGAFHAG